MKNFVVLLLCFTSMIIFAKDSVSEISNQQEKSELSMMHLSTQLAEVKLIGIKVRTSFNNENKWETGKIFPCVQRYFHEQLFERIPRRISPGTTYCVYTEYDSDYTGAYTYFIGEEVSSLDNVPNGLDILTIPSQRYAKFTTEPGSMPNVVKNAWQRIWDMSSETLGGLRSYNTDFEIYDERASDHNNLVLDIFVGIK